MSSLLPATSTRMPGSSDPCPAMDGMNTHAVANAKDNKLDASSPSQPPANITPVTAQLPTSENCYVGGVRLATTLNNVGVLLQESGKGEEAMKHYQDALKVRMDALKAEKDPGAKSSSSHDERSLAARCASAERTEMALQVRRSHLAVAVDPPFDLYPLGEDDEGEGTEGDGDGDGDGYCFDEDDCGVVVHTMSKPFQIAPRCPDAAAAAPTAEWDETSAASKKKDQDDRDSAITLYNMGLLYFDSDNFDHAEKMFEMARTALPSPSLCPALSAVLLQNIALIRLRDDNPHAAVDFLSESLQVLPSASEVGEDGKTLTKKQRRRRCCVGLAKASRVEFDPDRCTAFALSLLGRIYHVENHPRQAFDLLKECLKLRRSALGDDHIDVVSTLYNVGLTLRKLGDWNGAASHLDCFLEHESARAAAEAVSSATPTPPGSNPKDDAIEQRNQRRRYQRAAQVASAFHGAGTAHIRNRSVRKATEALGESLKIRRRLVESSMSGEDETTGTTTTAVASTAAALADAARTHVDLGRISHKQGRWREALLHYREALILFHQSVSPTTSLDVQEEMAAIHCLVGQVHQDRGEFDRSVASYRVALTTFRWAFGEMHPHVPSLLNVVGNVHLEMGDVDAAVTSFAEAARLAERSERLHETNESSLSSSTGGGRPLSSSLKAVTTNPLRYLGCDFGATAAAA